LAPAERLLAILARCCPGTMGGLPFRQALLRRTHGSAFAGRDSEIWKYFVHGSDSVPIRAVGHRAKLLQQLDLRSLLPKIRQPVLMICGDADPLVRKDCEDALLHG